MTTLDFWFIVYGIASFALGGVCVIYYYRYSRKQDAQALLESQQKYEELVDHLKIGVFRTTPGPQGKFLKVNSALVKITGADSRKELLRHNVRDLYLRQEERLKFSQKLLEQGFVKNEEVEAISLRGEPYWAQITAEVKKDGRGQMFFEGIIQDVTDKKKMELEVFYERAFSKNVINSIGDELVVVDCRDRLILDVNRAFLEKVRLKREDVVGRPCDKVVSHLCPTCEACGFDDVVKRAVSVVSTHIHEDKCGSKVYVDVTLTPLKNEKQEVVGVIHISRDVSERKHLEDELRHYSEKLELLVKERTSALQRSELMFRMLFETAQDGILIIDADDGKIIDVNPYVLKLMECGRRDIEGRHSSEVRYFPDSQIFSKIFEGLQDKISVSFDNVIIKTVKGRELITELRASYYYVDDKRIVQCNIRDITERKRLERAKSEFVSMVSHELRTPLSAIKEGVEIVSDGTQGTLNPGQRECLDIALSNIKRLNRLIGDILDISKIQSNLLKVESAACQVEEIVNHVSSLVKIEMEKRGMSFVVELERGLPLCLADKDRLIQVLLNLLNNAVKFTRKASQITLSACRAGAFVEFSVRDQGEGISADDLAQLFGRFVQLDSTLVRRAGGTGLGLHISKSLIEAMGGEIWAESKLGEGSIFKFTVPGA